MGQSAGQDDILASALAVNAQISYELGKSDAKTLAQSSVGALRSLREKQQDNRRLLTYLARSLYILAACTHTKDPAAAEAYAEEADQLSKDLDNDCQPPGIVQEARSFWQRKGVPLISA